MHTSFYNLTTANSFGCAKIELITIRKIVSTKRRLRLIYNDKKSLFKDLLEKGGSVSIHHRNLRTLAAELCKVFKGLSPVLLAEAFPVRQY